MTLTIGSLFSGIGGLELGLERGIGNGAHTVWQVEREPYCLQVLARHFPAASRFDDVCTVGAHNLPRVDVLCGGFPCQDLSYAGPGEGLSGERSGLWFQYERIIRELRPSYVVVENVAALLSRGMGVVLGSLAQLRYDAEWSSVSACAVGAPHMRQRVFIVAYAHGLDGRSRLRDSAARPQRALQTVDGFARARAGWSARLANPSALYGGAHGLPYGLERNHAIGNAVVPRVGEIAGRLIAERAARQAVAA